ncbi:hypothetical protein [Afipia felis]
MRDASLRAKCTWLLELLDHQPIAQNIVKAINEIGEIRNSFIHYKWPSAQHTNDGRSSTEDPLRAKLKKAESIARYFRKFEENQLYANQGHRVRRIVRAQKHPSKRPLLGGDPRIGRGF